jgi:hypothetical protein
MQDFLPGLHLYSDMTVHVEDFSSINNSNHVVVIHPEINDPENKRDVTLLVRTDVSTLFSTSSSYGHGAWYGKRDNGSHLYDKIFGEYEPVNDNSYLINNDENVDASIIGSRINGSMAIISGIERDVSGNFIVSFIKDNGCNNNSNLVPTTISVSVNNVGPESMSKFINKSILKNNTMTMFSDGEGSIYSFYIENGDIKCERTHANSKKIPVSIIGNLPKFTSVKSSVVLRKHPTKNTLWERFAVLSAVDMNGNLWVLTTSSITRSFSNSGAMANKLSLSLSQMALMGPHRVVSHEVLTLGQGTDWATAVIIYSNDFSMKWLSVNETILSMSNEGVIQSGSGEFKATSTDHSIEILIRTPVLEGGWKRIASRVPNAQIGTKWFSLEDSERGQVYPETPSCAISISSVKTEHEDSFKRHVVTSWCNNGIVNISVDEMDEFSEEISNNYRCFVDDVPTYNLKTIGGSKLHIFAQTPEHGMVFRTASIRPSDNTPYFSKPLYMEDYSKIELFTYSEYRIWYQYVDGVDMGSPSLPADCSNNIQYSPSLTYRGDVPIIKSNTLFIEEEDGYGLQEHDFHVVLRASDGKYHLSKYEKRVRLRSIIDQRVASAILGSRASQFSNVLSHLVEKDFVQTVGAGAASISVDGKEWFFVQNGELDGKKTSNLSILRCILSGDPLHPSYTVAHRTPSIKKRSHAGLYAIANANVSVTPPVPANSAILFSVGGEEGASFLTRLIISNLNDSTSGMTSVSIPNIDESASLSPFSGGYYKNKPVDNSICFLSFDGSIWKLIVISNNNVYSINDGSSGTLFGDTSLPNASDTTRFSVSNDAGVSFSNKTCMSYFQFTQSNPTVICHNSDFSVQRPGNTTVIAVDITGVFVYDYTGSESVNWEQVQIVSPFTPAPRTGAKLVWSGTKRGATARVSNYFIMHGGEIDGKATSETWILEYYRDHGGTPTGHWALLSSGEYHGLIPAIKHAYGMRRPVPTSKGATSAHGVLFGGGLHDSGFQENGIYLTHLPNQIKSINEAPLDSMVFDMSGEYLPSRPVIISEPIDVRNISRIEIPFVIESIGREFDPSFIRVAIGFDGIDNLYSLQPGTPWSWTSSFSISEIGEEACTLSEMSNLSDALLIRGTTPFFQNGSNFMYIVLYYPLMHMNDGKKLKSIRFNTRLQAHDATPDAKPTYARAPINLKAVNVGSRATLVRNDTGSVMNNVKVVITSKADHSRLSK